MPKDGWTIARVRGVGVEVAVGVGVPVGVGVGVAVGVGVLVGLGVAFDVGVGVGEVLKEASKTASPNPLAVSGCSHGLFRLEKVPPESVKTKLPPA